MDVEEEVEAVLAVYLDDMQDPPVFDDARRCCFRVRIMSVEPTSLSQDPFSV